MEKDNKKKRKGLDTFGILLVVLLLVAVASWLLAGRPYTDADGNAAAVVPATFANIIMTPTDFRRKITLQKPDGSEEQSGTGK